MMMDNICSRKYHIIYLDIHAYGWPTGWQIFESRSTPPIDLEPEKIGDFQQVNKLKM